jgi:hypothetical protein
MIYLIFMIAMIFDETIIIVIIKIKLIIVQTMIKIKV